jgi:recombination protein RecA
MKRVVSMAEKVLGIKPSIKEMLSFISKDAASIKTLSDIRTIPAVPTIFTSFNRAVVLGGAPAKTTWVVHGPPAGGKSAFALAMCNSFRKHGNIAAYIDAEYAMEKKWLTALQADMDGILYHAPTSFEDAFDKVDEWIINFEKAKIDGNIPDDTLFIIIVDTIHKMPCKREIASLRPGANNGNTTHGGDSMNKGWGMLRANMITTWMDHLTSQVSNNGIAFLALAHESPKKTETWGEAEYQVKGGKSLIHEAMVRVRIQPSKPILMPTSGGKKIIIGQEHNGTVEKNKVGHPYERFTFFTSNGKGGVPLGFDLVQEAVNECEKRKLLMKSGAWIYLPYDKNQKFNGKEKLMAHLREDAVAFEEFVDYLNDDLVNPEDYEYQEAEVEESSQDVEAESESENVE